MHPLPQNPETYCSMPYQCPTDARPMPDRCPTDARPMPDRCPTNTRQMPGSDALTIAISQPHVNNYCASLKTNRNYYLVI